MPDNAELNICPPTPEGKIFYGDTFDDLQKSVNDWLQDVNVHVYTLKKARQLESGGWIVGMIYYTPSVIYHKSATISKEGDAQCQI